MVAERVFAPASFENSGFMSFMDTEYTLTCFVTVVDFPLRLAVRVTVAVPVDVEVNL